MGNSSAQQRRNKAAERRAQRIKEARRRRILTITAVVAVVVLVVGGIAYLWYRDYERRNISGVTEFDVPSYDHVDSPVDYERTPPAGGDHYPRWQNCDVYTEPIVDEFAVHSLEHGAVWITYEPGLGEEQVSQLAERYTPGSYVLVSPYEGDMPAPIVASAWGKQLTVEDAGDERLDNFLQTYEQSSDVPEPGAACSGQIGQTAEELDMAGDSGGSGGDAEAEDGGDGGDDG
ncbi:hypothetical protein F4561_004399 [Lipingzhangella halophila]|uniref:DUF3105 domain-containing protein n=1 Tax=Lipingzhangella halophila TaxID=1783352 RepID=A0A7W7RKD0_9ACTN|nr:DUF3105 domain-containing protein [Lipingzhangella halophila]MBB4933579.1 hypothetical protein [Lipingzhangella halophila]